MAGKKNILIVDDESTLSSLALVLGKQGYATETARTGQEALKKAKRKSFKIALVDIRLPDMTGTELLQPFKEMQPDMAVVMTTAHTSIETAVRALNLGASAYITKPLNMQQVLATVREAIEKQRIIKEKQRAEEELKKSNEFHFNLIEQSPYPILVVDFENAIVRVNQALQELTGYSSSELIGLKPPHPWWTEETRPDKVERDRKAASKRKGQRFEEKFRKKNGEAFWVEITPVGVITEGKTTHFLTAWTDITERKKAEEKLKESEAKYSSLVHQALDGIVMLQDQVFKFVNPAFMEMIGYGEDELLGMSFLNVVEPGKRDLLKKRYERRIAGEDVLSIYETRLQHKNGTVRPVEVSGGLTQYQGRPATLYCVRDITERKQAEEEAEKLARLPRENPNPVLRVAEDGILLYANNASLPLLNLWDCQISQLIPDEHVREFVLGVLNTGSREDIELVCQDRIFSLTFAPIVDASYVNIYGLDITERKLAEEQARELKVLRELDRLRSELLSNISHEIRTPLASIKGFATTLLQPDVKWSEAEQHDFLQSIDQEADRLAKLISDVLDMSRLEAGALNLEKGNYQVSEILDSINDSLLSLTEHHQLEFVIPKNIPPVFVDEMRIGQVLTNLVENATKFSQKGSPITIDAELTNEWVVLSVTDKGEGFPPELLDRVFDRFYQTESIATGRKTGTGLGLSICRGIIEAHGGRIWAESVVGEGSRFSFSLPISSKEKEGV